MDSLVFTYTWVPPIIAAIVGIGVGAWAATTLGAADTGSREKVETLKAERQAILQQIHELGADRARTPAELFQATRETLILEAARLLKEIESVPKAYGGASLRGGAIAGVAGVCAVVLFLVASTVQGRLETAMAAASQGRAASSARGHASGGDDGAADLPSDLATLNKMAHAALLQGELGSAMSIVDKARAVNAQDPEVIVHVCALRVSVGMYAKAEGDLDKVLAVKPDMPEALLWKGVARARQGDEAGGRAALDRVIALDPSGEMGSLARSMLAEQPEPGAEK